MPEKKILRNFKPLSFFKEQSHYLPLDIGTYLYRKITVTYQEFLRMTHVGAFGKGVDDVMACPERQDQAISWLEGNNCKMG